MTLSLCCLWRCQGLANVSDWSFLLVNRKFPLTKSWHRPEASLITGSFLEPGVSMWPQHWDKAGRAEVWREEWLCSLGSCRAGGPAGSQRAGSPGAQLTKRQLRQASLPRVLHSNSHIPGTKYWVHQWATNLGLWWPLFLYFFRGRSVNLEPTAWLV